MKDYQCYWDHWSVQTFTNSFATPCDIALPTSSFRWDGFQVCYTCCCQKERTTSVTKTIKWSVRTWHHSFLQRATLLTHSHLQKVLSPTRQDHLNCVSSSLTLWTLPSYSRKPGLFGLVVSDPREAWQSVSTISRSKLGTSKQAQMEQNKAQNTKYDCSEYLPIFFK